MAPARRNRRPRRGFGAIVVTAFAVVLPGCVPGLQPQQPPVVAGTPGADPLPAQDLRPLGRALAIRLIDPSGEGLVPEGLIRRAERRLDLVKGVRVGTVAFLLAVFEERGQAAPVVGGFVHDGKAWQLEDLEPIRAVPAIGSNGFELVEAIAGGFIVVGGFVDPSLTRLDAVDPFGQVVDVDEPLAGGVLLFSSRYGVVRVHGDGRVLGAEPIRIPATEAELEELRPDRLERSAVEDARSVADRFVETFLTGGWVRAAPFYNPQGRPDLLLPELARVLPPGRWDIGGSPQVTEQGFTYPIDGPVGEARLAVRLNRWQGEWRVALVEFRTPPVGSGPIG